MTTPESGAGPTEGQEQTPKKLVGRAHAWIELHPWFTLSVVVSALLTFGVGPIRAILFDLPASTVWLRADRDSLLALGLWVWVILLAVGWIFALRIAIADPASHEDRQGLIGRLRDIPYRIAEQLERFVFGPVSRLSGRVRRVGGAATIAAGSLWWLGIAKTEMFAMMGPLTAGWGIGAMLAGGWLMLSAFTPEPELSPPGRARATMVAGRSLVMALFSTSVGHLMWYLAASPDTALTWRLFTFWAISHSTLTIVLGAQVVDALGRNLVERLVLGVPAVLLVVGSLAIDVPIGHVEAAPDEPTPSRAQGWAPVDSDPATALDLAWFDAVEARLARIPEDEPILFVAAAGGGSRSALYATLVLESLERTPTHGDYGDWTEAEEDRSLADRVLFISSVSGGSVAAAHFAYGLEASTDELRAPTNTIPKELRLHFLAELEKLCGSIETSCEAEQAVFEDGDRACRVDARLCREPDPAHPETTAGFDRKLYADNAMKPPWPVGSARFDDLATDFNAPMLRGLVGPAIERGESMSQFWRRRFGWNERYAAAQAGDQPVLLVNITDALRGTRIVASFPRMPRGLLGVRSDPHVYALALPDLHPQLHVQLEEAVRMSANFPWGFDVPLLGLGPQEGRIRAIDGGVLDNTGIDTFAVLLERLEYFTHVSQTGADESELARRAAALIDTLARRGVIVLEIDSGAKPEEPSVLAESLANATVPVQSLSVASAVRSSAATRDHVTRMSAVLDRRHDQILTDDESTGAGVRPPERLAGTRLVHVKYVLDTERIMTAWALTPTQKGQLLARFLAEASGRERAGRSSSSRAGIEGSVGSSTRPSRIPRSRRCWTTSPRTPTTTPAPKRTRCCWTRPRGARSTTDTRTSPRRVTRAPPRAGSAWGPTPAKRTASWSSNDAPRARPTPRGPSQPGSTWSWPPSERRPRSAWRATSRP